MKPPGGDTHDIFGQDFNGSPSHHRVLKPPGGGSTVIFGTTDTTDAMTPRRFAKYNQSGTLASVIGGAPPQNLNNENRKGAFVDSHKRLFGTPEAPAQTPSKNMMKSNIVLGEPAEHHENNGHSNGHAESNGCSDSASVSSNASVASNGSSNGSSMGRSRVPPGGYSSALW